MLYNAQAMTRADFHRQSHIRSLKFHSQINPFSPKTKTRM
jgi:hypothetical protein